MGDWTEEYLTMVEDCELNAQAIRSSAMCPTPHFAPQPISPQGGNGPLAHTNNPLSDGYGRYSERKALGCPTCDGVDATSCLRCHGKTRLFDWIFCDTGFEHRPPNATSKETDNDGT